MLSESWWSIFTIQGYSDLNIVSVYTWQQPALLKHQKGAGWRERTYQRSCQKLWASSWAFCPFVLQGAACSMQMLHSAVTRLRAVISVPSWLVPLSPLAQQSSWWMAAVEQELGNTHSSESAHHGEKQSRAEACSLPDPTSQPHLPARMEVSGGWSCLCSAFHMMIKKKNVVFLRWEQWLRAISDRVWMPWCLPLTYHTQWLSLVIHRVHFFQPLFQQHRGERTTTSQPSPI